MFEKTFVYKTPLLCNAKCGFCLSKANQTEKLYSYPKHKIVGELLNIKKKGFKSVILVGGESTIIENLEDYVKVADKLNIDLIITTNGIIFSDYDYLEYLYSIGLKNIIFSFHSHKKNVHDELVGVEGAFDCIEKAMKNAKKIGFKHISTSTVICKQNQESLSEIIKYIRDEFDININNFCNLEVSYKNTIDYNKKKYLFPDLNIIKQEIIKIHTQFFQSVGEIGIQNLPLCAYNKDTFYLTHEISGKERHYEEDFESEEEMNHRIKSDECSNCELFQKCKGYFPYFNNKEIIPFYDPYITK